jgi:tryptophan synthase beta subunit
MESEEVLIVNLSGRGDKDVDTVREKLNSSEPR